MTEAEYREVKARALTLASRPYHELTDAEREQTGADIDTVLDEALRRMTARCAPAAHRTTTSSTPDPR